MSGLLGFLIGLPVGGLLMLLVLGAMAVRHAKARSSIVLPPPGATQPPFPQRRPEALQ